MGFSFRRSVKMGPLRLNFSTAGVGISTGVRGARLSVGPRGTYVTLTRGGFQYRAPLGGTAARRARNPQSDPVLPTASAPPELLLAGNIVTASAEQLSALSADEALAEIQKCTSHFNWLRPYMCLASIALLCLLLASPLWAFLPVALITSLASAAVYSWDRERRTAKLFYDLGDPAIGERVMMAAGAGDWLARSCCLWHVYHAESTSDWKHNAGASGLIRRTQVQCASGSLRGIELNIETWCVPIGPQRLLFLPDRLLVIEGGRLTGIPYTALEVRRLPSRFIETGFVPPDAPLIEYTWQYVNKGGGPDLRFANNARLPVLEYAEVELRSEHGLRVVLQTSNPACAEGAVRALRALIDRSVTDVRVGPDARQGQAQ